MSGPTVSRPVVSALGLVAPQVGACGRITIKFYSSESY